MKTYCALCKCWYDENNQKTSPPDEVADISTNADEPESYLIEEEVATDPEEDLF